MLAFPQVVGFYKFLRKEPGVIDITTIHVADVNGAVWAGGEVHGARPFVGAAEPFGALAHAGGFQGGSVGLDFEAGDELPGGIADEDIVFQFGHEVAPVDAESAAGGVGAGVGIGSGVGDAQGIDAGGGSGDGNVLVSFFNARMGIADHGLPGHDREHDRIAVGAKKLVPPVVEGSAILAQAGGGFNFPGARIPPEIMAGHLHDALRGICRINFRGLQTIVKVHPVVRTPAWRTDLELAVVGVEAFDERLAYIRFAIAIGVFQKQDLRARGGDQAILEGKQSLHVIEMIREGHRPVHAAISIIIDELLDA